MLAFVITLQVIVALFLILVVLLQPGNKGGAGAALGGGGGTTVFGARGANTFLAKLTTASAIIFMLTNLSLTFVFTAKDRGVEKALEKLSTEAPANVGIPQVTPPEENAKNTNGSKTKE